MDVEIEPDFGPGEERFTRRSGAGTFKGWISIWWNSEKIAALAPMPSASVITTASENAGRLINWLMARFRSVRMFIRSGSGEGRRNQAFAIRAW